MVMAMTSGVRLDELMELLDRNKFSGSINIFNSSSYIVYDYTSSRIFIILYASVFLPKIKSLLNREIFTSQIFPFLFFFSQILCQFVCCNTNSSIIENSPNFLSLSFSRNRDTHTKRSKSHLTNMTHLSPLVTQSAEIAEIKIGHRLGSLLDKSPPRTNSPRSK